MNVLIKSTKIIDSNSPYNGKVMDILIENGFIKSIKENIKPTKGQKVIEEKNVNVSPGWFDMQVNFNDAVIDLIEEFINCICQPAF